MCACVLDLLERDRVVFVLYDRFRGVEHCYDKIKYPVTAKYKADCPTSNF